MQLCKRKRHVLLLGTSTGWRGRECPYGKGGQWPLELHLAEHHQQVQAGDPHPFLSSHTAEVLGPVLKGDMDMLD